MWLTRQVVVNCVVFLFDVCIGMVAHCTPPQFAAARESTNKASRKVRNYDRSMSAIIMATLQSVTRSRMRPLQH